MLPQLLLPVCIFLLSAGKLFLCIQQFPPSVGKLLLCILDFTVRIVQFFLCFCFFAVQFFLCIVDFLLRVACQPLIACQCKRLRFFFHAIQNGIDISFVFIGINVIFLLCGHIDFRQVITAERILRHI